MIEGFVKVPTETAKRAVENYVHRLNKSLDTIKEARFNAIDQIDFNWWCKFWYGDKISYFYSRFEYGFLDLLFETKKIHCWKRWLVKNEYIAEQDLKEYNYLYYSADLFNSIQDLCGVSVEYVYLNPSQARLVSEFGDE